MKKLVFVLFCAASIQSAFAGAIADKAKWDGINEDMDKAIAGAKLDDHCGPTLKVTYSFDKGSFKTPETMDKASWCAAAIEGLGTVCYDNPAKAEIVKAVRSIVCHYDASLKADVHNANKFAKKGTSIDVYFNKDSANIASDMKEFLKKEL